MDFYKESIAKMVTSVYSEYEWLPWKFRACPRNFWNDVNNQRKFMEWAGKELGIKSMEDWYKVKHKVELAVTHGLFSRI